MPAKRRKLGLDIGGVLLRTRHPGGMEWVPGAEDGLKRLCKSFRVYLISRIRRRGNGMELATLKFFRDNNVFMEAGLCEKNVRFVETPAEKLKVGKALGIDTFIDDRFDVLEPMAVSGAIKNLYIFNSQGRRGQKSIVLVKNWEELLDRLFPREFEKKGKRMLELDLLAERLYWYNYSETRVHPPREPLQGRGIDRFLDNYKLGLRGKKYAFKLVHACLKKFGISERVSGITDSVELEKAILAVLPERERAFFDVLCRLMGVCWECGDLEVPLRTPPDAWWREFRARMLELGIPEQKADYFYEAHYVGISSDIHELDENRSAAEGVASDIHDILMRPWKPKKKEKV